MGSTVGVSSPPERIRRRILAPSHPPADAGGWALLANGAAAPLRRRSRSSRRVSGHRQKNGLELIEDDWTLVTVDQFSKPVSTVLRRAWHRIGSRPTVEVAPSSDRVTVLGAVTHDGRSYYCWTEENLTADHGVRFLAALEAEFGEDLVVLIDRAGYFYAKKLWKFVSGEETTESIGDTSVERVRNDPFEAWYFPPRLPKLNPVEQCWNQLDAWFNHRLIEDLTQLQVDLRIALEELSEPNVFNYLLPEEYETDLKTN